MGSILMFINDAMSLVLSTLKFVSYAFRPVVGSLHSLSSKDLPPIRALQAIITFATSCALWLAHDLGIYILV